MSNVTFNIASLLRLLTRAALSNRDALAVPIAAPSNRDALAVPIAAPSNRDASVFPTITPRDLALFFHQLATLLSAGIPIIDCLNLIEQSHTKPAMQQLTTSIKQQLHSGKTLFASMQTLTLYFSALTLQLIYLGEQTGKLEAMLFLITQHLESQLALQEKIKKILFYPCFLSGSAFCLTLILFIFIVPRFANLFQAMPGELPLLTRCIFNLSHALQHLVWIFGLGIIPLCFFCWHPLWRKRIKRRLKKLAARLPLIRSFIHLHLLVHFSQQLLCAISAGIPMTEGLGLIAEVSEQPEWARILIQLQYKMRQGYPLHHAMATLAIFPILLTQMLRMGEESGKVETMLNKIIALYSADIDRLLHRFTTLLEPLIMLVLGVLIGGLVIGMYLPIFNLGSLF